jgi:hypothetical protein
MGTQRILWYRRFRGAALLSSCVAFIWTVIIILPVDPFNSLLPVMIDGGAGTWLLLGYLLYLAVGIGGFGAVSAMLASLELDEGRVPNRFALSAGLILLLVGVNASCVLLGLAGGYGGYSQNIQHASGGSLDSLLTPFVNLTRLTTVLAVAGGVSTVLGIAVSKGEKRSE